MSIPRRNTRSGQASPRITSIEQGDDEITFLDEELLHELDGGDEVENRPVDPIILEDDDVLISADVPLDDDAFSLPEDDGASPDEVLRIQKTAFRAAEVNRKPECFTDRKGRSDGKWAVIVFRRMIPSAGRMSRLSRR